MTPTKIQTPPGETPFERFKELARRVVSAPKSEVDKAIAATKTAKPKRRKRSR